MLEICQRLKYVKRRLNIDLTNVREIKVSYLKEVKNDTGKIPSNQLTDKGAGKIKEGKSQVFSHSDLPYIR